MGGKPLELQTVLNQVILAMMSLRQKDSQTTMLVAATVVLLNALCVCFCCVRCSRRGRSSESRGGRSRPLRAARTRDDDVNQLIKRKQGGEADEDEDADDEEDARMSTDMSVVLLGADDLFPAAAHPPAQEHTVYLE